MCTHYDTAETSKQCTEDDAERIHDKVNANFCDFFRPSTSAFDGRARSAEQKAKAELDALFSERADERSGNAGNTDDALANARALFDD